MNNNFNDNFADKSKLPFKESFVLGFKRLNHIVQQLMDEVQQINEPSSTVFEPNFDLANQVRNYEIKLIELALKVSKGSQTKAIRLLGIKKTTLNAKIKRYNICLNDTKF